MTLEGKKQKNKVAPEPLEPQPLEIVLKALLRAQTRALIFEHVSELVATQFRGNDARGPAKLLAMPDGAKCKAEPAYVLEIEDELRSLASDARAALAELNRAAVMVPRTSVRPNETTRRPVVEPPQGEGIADAPAPAPSTSATATATRTVSR